MPSRFSNYTLEFAKRINSLGFTVYIAENEGYGFITDATGNRVLCFDSERLSLGGNYWPHSVESGTGWVLEETMDRLRTAEDVSRALYSTAPLWCGRGFKTYTTLEQHLKTYGPSSRYTKYSEVDDAQ